jgi:hypothetical protein
MNWNNTQFDISMPITVRAARQVGAKFNGDYRTKRTILEIYDALAEAMQTGNAYQTRLDSPPADPRSCHRRRLGEERTQS